YNIVINRSGLLDGEYEGVLRFTPNRGLSIDVRVAMQVGDLVAADASAPQYVLVTDAEKNEVVAQGQSNLNGRYQVKGIPAGNYVISAGSDIDNDLFVCQQGETCGEFPQLFNSEALLIENDISGIDMVITLLKPATAARVQQQDSKATLKLKRTIDATASENASNDTVIRARSISD
ncbi:MAG: hypothetical protein P1U57_09115, partial [Oleibacter sp.]|nr:hypothetical protein [Thalassolituus sp.]